jgi:hypothetical protein
VCRELTQLTVSDNRRYLQDASGEPSFRAGDCPQNLPLKRAIPALDEYLAAFKNAAGSSRANSGARSITPPVKNTAGDSD